jgi:FkbM family methyltransferase
MAGIDYVRPSGTSSPSHGPRSSVENLIFDVGLNIGQDTGFYLSQGYHVLAIEADPKLAEAARKKFHREIRESRLEVLNVGIAEKDGFADFWICEEKPEFNSFHRQIAARDSYSHHSTQIPVLRFASVIERYGIPHYLKIDIEGNDMLCLDGLNSSTLPKYVSVESECPLDEQSGSVEDGLRTLQKLASLGYNRFKLIDQFTFCSLSLPPSPDYRVDAFARKVFNQLPLKKIRGLGLISRHLIMRSRLQGRFRWKFPMGSSGVWGEDTPGNWISYGEAEQAYCHYREKHFLASDPKFHSFWCDWHAKQQ